MNIQLLDESIACYDSETKVSKFLITFETKSGSRIVDIRQVLYLEVTVHQLTIHVKEDTFVIYGTLSKYEQLLGPYGFIKTYKCYLVNYRFIKCVSKKDLILKDDCVLAISRNSAEEINRKMLLFIQYFDMDT